LTIVCDRPAIIATRRFARANAAVKVARRDREIPGGFMFAATRKWLLTIAACSTPMTMIMTAQGHHSVAEFDTEQTLTLDAVVKEVWFSNPHIRYYVAIKNSAGVEEVWDVHGSSVTSLARRGWTKNTIKVGDKIKVTGSPNRDGVKRILIRTVTLANGTTLGGASSQNSDAENYQRRPE
jgi:hypothetical protein